MSEAPASGSAITLSSETISATSGTWIKPPSPITSTGIPAERSALSIAAIWERLRTNTAKVVRLLAGVAKRFSSNQSGAK